MYTKLHSTILDSTIWQEAKETKILWITLLAMCDQNGEVMASIPGLARRAGITLEECETALNVLLSPDKYSRTADDDGRRIAEIDGGWEVLNHRKYREIGQDHEHRRKNAERQKRWRERHKRNATVTPRNDKTETETDTETDTDKRSVTDHSERKPQYAPTRMAPDSDLNDHKDNLGKIAYAMDASVRLGRIYRDLGEPSERGTRHMCEEAAKASVTTFSENWLVDSIEAVVAKAPKNKWAYFRRCLQNKAKESGGTFA